MGLQCIRCGVRAWDSFSSNVAGREEDKARGFFRNEKEVCCVSCRPEWRREREAQQRREADMKVGQCCVCKKFQEEGKFSKSQRAKPQGGRKCSLCAQRSDAERKLLHQGHRTESSQRVEVSQERGADDLAGEEAEGEWQMIEDCCRCPRCEAECTADHSLSAACSHAATKNGEAHAWITQRSWRMHQVVREWTGGRPRQSGPDNRGGRGEGAPV